MFEWLGSGVEYLQNAITELMALVSIILLVILFFLFDFKFVLRSYTMLRKIFKAQNMSMPTAFSIAWRIKKIDREEKKARYKYLKAFCEYAIFESEGEKLKNSEWNSIAHKYFYENLIVDPFIITLDSTFDILNSDVDTAIKKYFKFLNANDKKYMHNKKLSKFMCRLSFENGYVYPASF
ncbi:MAG: hypothetical protein IJZ26_01190, partial [Clostridia bacterium]|nr:hypothetical protein [Clostridia bacterium]